MQKEDLDRESRVGQGEMKRNCLDESQKFESGPLEEQRARNSPLESAQTEAI